MRKTTIKLIVVFVLIFFSSINAQVFQISANSFSSTVLGDITEKELNKNGAGYVDFGYGGGIEFKYYINNWGLGVKWAYNDYEIDIESYQTDLKNELGITDDLYKMTQPSAYMSNNFSFGLSYIIKSSDKFQFEPYLYVGLTAFISPFEHIVYSKSNTTFTYRKDVGIYVGFCYAPGLKFQWNITKNIGLNIFTEYSGVSLFEEVEESTTYSYNSFEKNSVTKSYSPQSFNIGLGISYTFGKGLYE